MCIPGFSVSRVYFFLILVLGAMDKCDADLQLWCCQQLLCLPEWACTSPLRAWPQRAWAAWQPSARIQDVQ
eukprot:6492301-Amphidinium_carterae.7